MNSSTRFIALVGLLLLLNVSPSWGQLVNPTVSDGNHNTAGGSSVLSNLTTGASNTAFGFEALFNNTFGNSNTATGADALLSNTSGSENVALGVGALFDNITGRRNTAVGRSALRHSTGTKNIGIGYQAGTTLTAGSNNIYIGNQGVGDESQTIRIGTAQASTFIAGIADAFIANNRAGVFIDTSTGQLGLGPMISSERYKQDILPIGASSQGVLQLRPVMFSYKQDAQRTKHYGLLAEEVAGVYPELVARTASGEPQAVQYQELIPMLLNELQRQQKELAEVAALRKELAELRAVVGSLQRAQAGSRPAGDLSVSQATNASQVTFTGLSD